MILVFTFDTVEERDKFDYLYRKYKDLLFYKAWGILHDHMLAEDALSEAYIRIYRNLEKVEDVNSPRTIAFLTTIVRNTALTILSRTKSETVEEPDENIADTQNLEDDVLSAISSENLVLIIGKLDEQSRNIFLLKYAYDLPHKEIAEQLNTTENNITVKLHRVKKKLSNLASMEGLR